LTTESIAANKLHFLLVWCKKIRNLIVLSILFPVYHLYDGLCYIVANTFGFFKGTAIMFAILFLVSVGAVYLHSFCERKYDWDMLSMGKINNFINRENRITRHKIFKRFIAWILQKGGFWAVYLVVPIIFGPFVSTIILRKKNNLLQNLAYIIPGAVLSALFWVSVWTGVGLFTWDKYVKPFLSNLSACGLIMGG